MSQRPPAPQRLRHHHRPAISFKEQKVNRELLAVSSALTASSILALQTALKFSKLLTADRSLATPKFPVAQSPPRLPRYKDPRACVAGTCPTPKLPGKSDIRAPPRRRRPARSFAAADESTRVPACPSPTADRSSSFCQGTCAAPDPSRARETTSVRWLPIRASGKCARIHRSGSSRKTASRTSLQRNAEKGRGLSAGPWNRFALCNFHEALRLIPETSGDDSAVCAAFELDSCRLSHFTPLRSTRGYYACRSGLSTLF